MWEPHPKEALATVSESLTKTDQNRSYHSETYLGFTHSTNFPWVYVNGVGDYGVVRSCFTWSVKWWCVLWPGEMLGCEMRVGMKSFGQRPLSVWGQRKQHSAALFPPNHISSFLSLVSVSLSHTQPRRRAHTHRQVELTSEISLESDGTVEVRVLHTPDQPLLHRFIDSQCDDQQVLYECLLQCKS